MAVQLAFTVKGGDINTIIPSVFDVCPKSLHTGVLILLLGDNTTNVFPVCLSLLLLYLLLEFQITFDMLRVTSFLLYLVILVLSFHHLLQFPIHG